MIKDSEVRLRSIQGPQRSFLSSATLQDIKSTFLTCVHNTQTEMFHFNFSDLHERFYSSSVSGVSLFTLQEPSNKRVKPVGKSNSITGIITPVKTPALKRLGQSITVRPFHKDPHV